MKPFLSVFVAFALFAGGLRAQRLIDNLQMGGASNQVKSGATLTIVSGGTLSYAAGASFGGSASEFRDDIGLEIGADVQAYSSALATYASIAPSANVQVLLGAADYAAFRSSLSLTIGTDVQAYDADLDTYAGITPSANVQAILGAADYAAMRTLLALVIGTNVQAYDADLTTFAGISPTANVQSILGAADYAAVRSLLGVSADTLPAEPTEGDLAYYDGEDWVSLAIGTAGQVLTTNGTADAPEWAEAPATGAPADATYVVQVASDDLSAEQPLADLATGILKNTTTTGVLSIAVAGTDYLAVPDSSAEGDILYRDASAWTRLARGSDGQVLKATSSSIAWGTDSTGSGSLPGSPTEGDLAYFDGADWVSLAIGDPGEVLSVDFTGAAPVWSAAGSANPLPGLPLEGDIVYFDGADWVSLAIGAAGEVLATNATEDAPEWIAPGMTNPMTTAEDLIVAGTGGTPERLAAGSEGQVLTIATGAVAWGDLPNGGTLTLARFTALDNQPPASTYATFDTRNSIAVLDFDAGTAESAVFVGIVPEAADFTTGIAVRIHWTATTATTGDVIWTSAIERANTDLDSDSFATGIDSAAATANGTSGIATVTTINHSGSEIDGVTAGDLFRVRITRKAADGADTMTGDAEVIAVELRQR